MYDEKYFKNKFPKCTDQTINLFVQIANDKIVSKQRKKKSSNNDPIKIDIQKGNFIVYFN